MALAGDDFLRGGKGLVPVPPPQLLTPPLALDPVPHVGRAEAPGDSQAFVVDPTRFLEVSALSKHRPEVDVAADDLRRIRRARDLNALLEIRQAFTVTKA